MLSQGAVLAQDSVSTWCACSKITSIFSKMTRPEEENLGKIAKLLQSIKYMPCKAQASAVMLTYDLSLCSLITTLPMLYLARRQHLFKGALASCAGESAFQQDSS